VYIFGLSLYTFSLSTVHLIIPIKLKSKDISACRHTHVCAQSMHTRTYLNESTAIYNFGAINYVTVVPLLLCKSSFGHEVTTDCIKLKITRLGQPAVAQHSYQISYKLVLHFKCYILLSLTERKQTSDGSSLKKNVFYINKICKWITFFIFSMVFQSILCWQPGCGLCSL
jgi:hypothetical protein